MEEEIKVYENIKYKAQFSFGGDTWFMSTGFPNWFQRIMQYILLGVKWKKF